LTAKVGIVVPTLGTRPEYLPQCLNSIRASGQGDNSPFVIIVAPASFDATKYVSSGLAHHIVRDPGSGLASAINAGFEAMPSDVDYMNWLGDDDLLEEGTSTASSMFLDEHPKTVMVFGGSHYVSPEGIGLWTNNSGPWAVPLMRFGPNLIPQPGALFRKKSFFDVGGLNPKYGWAFDFDLFIRLSKIGRISHMNKVVSSFRWHPGSLSVRERDMSVAEASQIRLSHLPNFLRPISLLWEFPVRRATLLAGVLVSTRAKKESLN